MARYILTGGTGFLGSLLGEELLKRGHTVVFLGRSKGDKPYELRQREILNNLDADVPLLNALFHEANIHKENMGLSDDMIGKLKNFDGLFHLAAELSFRRSNRNRVFEMNIESLHHVTALSSLIHTPLLYTSTAYVHGAQPDGSFMGEHLYKKPKTFNNPYEESKYCAEVFIHTWARDAGARFAIFRPSIIIDKDGRTSTPYGFYSFILGLIKLKALFGASVDEALSLPMPFPYYARARLNLVRADLVVRWMIEIVEGNKYDGRTYHLTTQSPFSMERIIREVFEECLHLRLFAFSAPKWIVKLWIRTLYFFSFLFPQLGSIAERMFLFKSYMTTAISYDTSNLKNATAEDLDSLSLVPEGYLATVGRHFVRNYEKYKLIDKTSPNPRNERARARN